MAAMNYLVIELINHIIKDNSLLSIMNYTDFCSNDPILIFNSFSIIYSSKVNNIFLYIYSYIKLFE